MHSIDARDDLSYAYVRMLASARRVGATRKVFCPRDSCYARFCVKTRQWVAMRRPMLLRPLALRFGPRGRVAPSVVFVVNGKNVASET